MNDLDPLNATIVRRRDHNANAAVVWVRPDEGVVAPFTAGQFIQLGLPKPREADDTRLRWIKRSYSIASAPDERDAFELCLALVPNGALTPRLWSLGVGDRVWCDNAPKGHFTLERIPRSRQLVMVATGTGVAPFVSMLRAASNADEAPWQKLVIVHGVREASDLCYDSELRRADGEGRLRYVPVVSREPDAWNGLRGRVQVALEEASSSTALGIELDPLRTHVLLCGNPAMIEDVRTLLVPRGFVVDTVKVPGNVHFERYW